MPKVKVNKGTAPKKAKTAEKAEKAAAAPAKKGNAAIMAFINEINKNSHFKGVAQVQLASEMHTNYLLRRPTGILSVDLALGGGFHAGGTTEVHGAESVGKTHLVFRAAGEVQKNYGDDTNILILATEMRPDKGFARKSGFCVPYAELEIEEYDRLRMARGMPTFTAVELDDLRFSIGNVVVISAATGDIGLDAVIKGLESGIFQMIIEESLGALLTPQQDEKDTGDKTVGGTASIITMYQNKVYPLLIMDRADGSLNETTIIGVGQARADIGGMSRHGPSEKSSTGSFAAKHSQMSNVRLSKGQNIIHPTTKKMRGREIHWNLTKGKAGTHDGKRGTYSYYHMSREDPVFWSQVQLGYSADDFQGIDTMSDAVEAAKELGVIQVSGSWCTWHDLRVQGLDNLAVEIATLETENPDIRKQLVDECMAASGIMVRYR